VLINVGEVGTRLRSKVIRRQRKLWGLWRWWM